MEASLTADVIYGDVSEAATLLQLQELKELQEELDTELELEIGSGAGVPAADPAAAEGLYSLWDCRQPQKAHLLA